MSVVEIDRVCGPNLTVKDVDDWIALQPDEPEKDFLHQVLARTRRYMVIAKIVVLDVSLISQRSEGKLPLEMVLQDWDVPLSLVQILTPTEEIKRQPEVERLLELALASHCSMDVIIYLLQFLPLSIAGLLNTSSFRMALLLWRGVAFTRTIQLEEGAPCFAASRNAIVSALFRAVTHRDSFLVMGLEDCMKFADDGSLPIHRDLEDRGICEAHGHICPEVLAVPDEGGMLPLHRHLYLDYQEAAEESLAKVGTSKEVFHLLTMLERYPKAAQEEDATGNLPLHYALRRVVFDEVLSPELLRAFPEATRRKSSLGGFPLHSVLDRYWDRHPSRQCKASVPLIKEILKGNPDACRMADNDGRLPLHYSIRHVVLDEHVSFPLLKLFPQAALHQCLQGHCPLHVLMMRGAAPWDEGDSMERLAKHMISVSPSVCRLANEKGKIPLHYAMELDTNRVDAGPVAVLGAFLDGLSVKSKDGETPLFNALRGNACDALLIRKLVQVYPAPLKQTNTEGMLPLHCLLAISGSIDPETIECVLTSYPKAVAKVDGRGNSPLHYAVRHAELDEVVSLALLRRHPASCRVQGDKGRLPIHSLLWRDVDRFAESFGSITASRTMDHRCVHLLSELISAYPEGCQVPDEEGNLPLHLALIYPDLDSVSLSLLDRYPAAVRERDARGRLPWHWFVERGMVSGAGIQVFARLRQLCPDGFGLVDQDGDTPLHRAMLCPSPNGFVTHSFAELTLKAYPKAAEITNELGRLPLHVGIRAMANNAEFDVAHLRMLLKAFPKACEIPDKDGDYPLHHSCKCRQLDKDLTMDLLKACPQIASKIGGNGQLPLHALLARDDGAAVRPLLVKALLKVYRKACSVPDSYGALPLHYAVDHMSLDEPVLIDIFDAFPDGARHENDIGQLPVHSLISSVLAGGPERNLLFKKLMLHYPEAVERIDCHGSSPIHHALERSSLDDLSCQLVDRFPNILWERDGSNVLPFHALLMRVLMNREETVPALLQTMLDLYPGVSSKLNSANTLPLHQSLSDPVFDDTISVRLLQLYPEAVNLETPSWAFPIHVLARRLQNGILSDASMIKRYLKMCPQACFAREGHFGDTPLHTLLRGSSYDNNLSLEMVEACPDVLKVRNKKGHLPIHALLLRKRVKVGDSLLKRMIELYPAGCFLLDEGPRTGMLPIECAFKVRMPSMSWIKANVPAMLQVRDPETEETLLHRLLSRSSAGDLIEFLIFAEPSLTEARSNTGHLPVHVLVEASTSVHRKNLAVAKAVISAYPEGATSRPSEAELPAFLQAAVLKRSVALIYELIRIDPSAAISLAS